MEVVTYELFAINQRLYVQSFRERFDEHEKKDN